jgi:hypothetical protein
MATENDDSSFKSDESNPESDNDNLETYFPNLGSKYPVETFNQDATEETCVDTYTYGGKKILHRPLGVREDILLES